VTTTNLHRKDKSGYENARPKTKKLRDSEGGTKVMNIGTTTSTEGGLKKREKKRKPAWRQGAKRGGEKATNAEENPKKKAWDAMPRQKKSDGPSLHVGFRKKKKGARGPLGSMPRQRFKRSGKEAPGLGKL